MSPDLATVSDELETVGHIRAMASDICVRARRDTADVSGLPGALAHALQVFGDVEAACTRFDSGSPLMLANARPTEVHRVPEPCFEALREAHRCYEETGGRFDPRILADLVALGYDRSLSFASADIRISAPESRARRPFPRWEPRLWEQGREVSLGPFPVDLGGIGKGLAVRWASEVLGRVAPDHLVEAGGDCYCAGSTSGGGPWLVGVEDPGGEAEPRAVLALRDLACATSSIRLRRWLRNGRRVHHLVDPMSGRPGGHGLQAVTVVMADPADAEVWAKVLFLAGRAAIAAEAERRRLAALWVDDAGVAHASTAMGQHLRWGPR